MEWDGLWPASTGVLIITRALSRSMLIYGFIVFWLAIDGNRAVINSKNAYFDSLSSCVL